MSESDEQMTEWQASLQRQICAVYGLTAEELAAAAEPNAALARAERAQWWQDYQRARSLTRL